MTWIWCPMGSLEGEHTQRQRGEGHVKIRMKTRQKLDLGYKPRKAKHCLQPWEKGEKHGMDSPSEPPEGTNAADTLILGF